MYKHYDIVINGGGIVGFTFLNLLLKSQHLNKLKVLLIEQASRPSSFTQPPRRASSGRCKDNQTEQHSQGAEQFSNRVSSITASSQKVFESLGVWERVEPFAKDVDEIKVWNHDYSHKIIFGNRGALEEIGPTKRDVIFSVLENYRLSRALLDNVSSHLLEDEPVLWNHTLEHISESSDREGVIHVMAKNSKSDQKIVASACLVLGCDGFKSKVRELSNIRYYERYLDKDAIVGTVRIYPTPFSGQNTAAYQKFSSGRDTVAALLPLSQEYSSFVISAPEAYSEKLMNYDDETFISEFNLILNETETPRNTVVKSLHSTFSSVLELLPDFSSTSQCQRSTNDLKYSEPPRLDSLVKGTRAKFPLFFGTTTPEMIKSLHGKEHAQIALLGDSSHRIHPLAGQGLNLGIQDAFCLFTRLENIAKNGERIFNVHDLSQLDRALNRYEIDRQAYFVPLSASIMLMPYLFEILPKELISLVNKCDLIKSLLVKVANGYPY